jgi:hypothetical protein
LWSGSHVRDSWWLQTTQALSEIILQYSALILSFLWREKIEKERKEEGKEGGVEGGRKEGRKKRKKERKKRLLPNIPVWQLAATAPKHLGLFAL